MFELKVLLAIVGISVLVGLIVANWPTFSGPSEDLVNIKVGDCIDGIQMDALPNGTGDRTDANDANMVDCASVDAQFKIVGDGVLGTECGTVDSPPGTVYDLGIAVGDSYHDFCIQKLKR
jgi:hypothetical protein